MGAGTVDDGGGDDERSRCWRDGRYRGEVWRFWCVAWLVVIELALCVFIAVPVVVAAAAAVSISRPSYM